MAKAMLETLKKMTAQEKANLKKETTMKNEKFPKSAKHLDGETNATTIARYAPKAILAGDPKLLKIEVYGFNNGKGGHPAKLAKTGAECNPKRPETKCFEWFTWYRTGMTVAEYYAKGGRADHIRWDAQHGFIRLVPVKK
jgi:hypothetical protein